MASLVLHGIVGARPNLMKMAPLAKALARDGTFALSLVHTGQHYDDKMSQVFFDELGLPAPKHNLDVRSGSHGAQTARVLERYEQILLEGEKPCGVIVLGDVNSTLACSLAATKLGIPVAHVEAGLRSNDRAMPEEINRLVTDAISDLLFVSDPDGLTNLAREGHGRGKIRFVGNIMIDNLTAELPKAAASGILDELGLAAKGYGYVTLHRPSNVDDPVVLRGLIDVLRELSMDLPLVFSVHPRTAACLERAGIALTDHPRLRIIGPAGYTQNLRLMRDAVAVLTDSGGIQEETSALGVPCLTLRHNTERPVTVELGTSELVGNDPARIRSAWQRVRQGKWKSARPIPLWDGRTSERIVEHLRQAWATRSSA